MVQKKEEVSASSCGVRGLGKNMASVLGLVEPRPMCMWSPKRARCEKRYVEPVMRSWRVLKKIEEGHSSYAP